MGSTFEDTLQDFNLDLLSPSPSVVNQRQSILKLKSKVCAISYAINKYHESKEQFAQREVLLLAAKEECKQVCIDYKESLEKCSQLEKDIKSFQEKNKILERNCELTQNQLKGLESHAKQLQLLANKHETIIGDLKKENQLEKNSAKEYEKKVLSLQKENEALLKNLCLARDIALGKKKLRKHHKVLLQKYNNDYTSEDHSSSESSSDEIDLFDSSPPSPINPFGAVRKSEEVGIKIDKGEICILKRDTVKNSEDHDSDCSNEIVSEDTGRGSSLAYSDGDKCFNSPDYFNHDSPFVSECNKIREKRVFFDACTSPIIVNEIVHVATSPLIFDDEALLSDNNTLRPIETESNNTEYFITDIPLSTEVVTIKEKKTLVNAGTSTQEDFIHINVSTSPVSFKEPYIDKKVCMDSATSPIPIMENNNMNIIISTEDNNEVISNNIENETLEDILPSPEKRHKTIKNLSSQCEIEICSKSVEERKCLERNNSRNFCDETSNDCEIEMILNTMRLTDRLITPIPSTPIINKKPSRNELTRHLTEVPEEHSVCAEATKLREEHHDLLKEVLKIKSILKKQKLMPESPTKQKESSHINNLEVCHDSGDDMLTIELEIEHDNSRNLNHETLDTSENIMTSCSPILENYVLEDVKPNSLFSEVIQEMQTPSALKFQKTTDNSGVENPVPTVNNSRNSFDIVRRLESTLEENNIEMNEVEEPLTCESNNREVVEDNTKQKVKSKKLSRLDKFRKKLIPKNKIKKVIVPIKNTCSKPKLKPILNCKNAEAELLKSQLAYEKARQVMAEINLKKGNKESRKVNKEVPDVKEAQFDECNNNDQIITRRKSREMLSSPRRNSSSDINQPNMEISLKNINEDREYKKVEQLVSEIKVAPPYDNNNKIARRKSRDMLLSPRRSGGSDIKQPVICLNKINMDNVLNKEKEQKNNQPSPKKSEVITSKIDDLSKRKIIYTRSRSRSNNRSDPTTQIKFDSKNSHNLSFELTEDTSVKSRLRLKRLASDNSPTECKRILRSHHVRQMVSDHEVESDEIIPNDADTTVNTISDKQNCIVENNENLSKLDDKKYKSTQSEFSSHQDTGKNSNDINSTHTSHPKDSVLCKMLDKYGKSKTKFTAKKIPEETVNLISKKLEESIEKINEMPVGDKSKSAMIKLVEEIQLSWNRKNFLSGLMHYLKDPARKQELFTKISTPPAPPMTKSEQILLFIMKQIEISRPNTISNVLTQIEFSLFQLNRTPEFDVIESLSHFYALLCRYFGFKNRLRLFILDAMYCLQFKVVPLIKQCLDVWMHILPLAHMGIAKSPLVTCLVYLLHFYKCEDKFNRVQEIRFILHKKYFYKITDWNEPKILEMFRNSIKELREIKVEKRMLRMAFIIIAKRQGPKWCQKNIIKNMLLPMIEKEDIPFRIKQFCVELLGPLLKPYPMDMKVHCEIVVNQLLDMLDTTTSDSMRESILTSLIYMNKHNQSRVTKALLSWMPKNMSSEFEELMRDFVQEKPLNTWKRILSKTTV